MSASNFHFTDAQIASHRDRGDDSRVNRVHRRHGAWGPDWQRATAASRRRTHLEDAFDHLLRDDLDGHVLAYDTAVRETPESH